jgi:hypothetical protein
MWPNEMYFMTHRTLLQYLKKYYKVQKHNVIDVCKKCNWWNGDYSHFSKYQYQIVGLKSEENPLKLELGFIP